MATNFPSSLDSFANPSASDALDSVSVPHADQHANINDAMEAVQTKLGTGAGTIGEWTTYTPSLSNFTVTSMDCKYCKINKIVFVNYLFNVNAVTGNPSFMTPTTIGDNDSITGHGAMFLDQGSAWYTAQTFPTLGGVGWFRPNVVGSKVTLSGVNATSPFTWATSDAIIGNLWYLEA